MAKKTANPADAFRKAQRARELKKNKEARAKTRETQTVKKDTRDIEGEISRLKGQPSLDAAGKSRLETLQSELAYIIKTKEKFVEEHPEARDKVFRTRGPRRENNENDQGEDGESGKFGQDGRPRDPTRSIYFDPVYNPYGVPPPGMPYKERTPEEESEAEDDEEDEDESDDEIVMPEGRPPGESDSDDSDDSDDIPLPEGPPPPKGGVPAPPSLLPGLPSGPSGPSFFRPQPPFPPQPQPFGPWGQPWGGQDVPYVPQPGPPGPDFRPRPPPSSRPHAPTTHFRPPAVQDPLSDAPTQTYQGYRMQKHELPARPGGPPALAGEAGLAAAASASSSASASTSKPVDYSAGAISAAPVMRDLRKEATAFVPRGVKRKKVVPGGVSVNATPGAGDVDEDGDARVSKRIEEGGGLLGKLRGVLGDAKQASGSDGGGGGSGGAAGGGGDDDYQKFLEGLGDMG